MLPGEGRNVPAALGGWGKLRASERLAALLEVGGETVVDVGLNPGSRFSFLVRDGC